MLGVLFSPLLWNDKYKLATLDSVERRAYNLIGIIEPRTLSVSCEPFCLLLVAFWVTLVHHHHLNNGQPEERFHPFVVGILRVNTKRFD